MKIVEVSRRKRVRGEIKLTWIDVLRRRSCIINGSTHVDVCCSLWRQGSKRVFISTCQVRHYVNFDMATFEGQDRDFRFLFNYLLW